MKVQRLVGEYFIYNNPAILYIILYFIDDIVWTTTWVVDIGIKSLMITILYMFLLVLLSLLLDFGVFLLTMLQIVTILI